MAFFCAIATPLLLALLVLGAGNHSYICEPFHQGRLGPLDQLSQALWPSSERGVFFQALSPSLLTTHCGPAQSEGALQLALRSNRLSPSTDMPSDAGKSETWEELALRGLRCCARYAARHLDLPPEFHEYHDVPQVSCKPLLKAFNSAMAAHCDFWLPGLAGVWLALSVDVLRYTIAMTVCLGASKYLVHTTFFIYEGRRFEISDKSPGAGLPQGRPKAHRHLDKSRPEHGQLPVKVGVVL